MSEKLLEYMQVDEMAPPNLNSAAVAERAVGEKPKWLQKNNKREVRPELEKGNKRIWFTGKGIIQQLLSRD